MAFKRTQLRERYELGEVLGRGGMGVVYRAHDRIMQREVALKTILCTDDATSALFYDEWNLLAAIVHPNVVNIYDIGEFEHEGAQKPFFVMPLLPGVTLDQLIKAGSPRLSVGGVLEIIEQACRGLQAAHDQGLVHRDVKPSNIFVMDDNSVKIIDFGIARGASPAPTTLDGTLAYMCPEQFEGRPLTALSDLFALGVVTYEALTKRRPFAEADDVATIQAIRSSSPAPASEINADVNYAVSQVVNKAIAKNPARRFANMREFGIALKKAMRNEPLEWLDGGRMKARLERASRSFETGDYGFADEVLADLESEGHLDEEIARLRARVGPAMRQARIGQLLESAQRFSDAAEFSLARRKIVEALELNPNDPGALAQRDRLEKMRLDALISEQRVRARQYLEQQEFAPAREALDSILQIRPDDAEALDLVADLERREKAALPAPVETAPAEAEPKSEPRPAPAAAAVASAAGDIEQAVPPLVNAPAVETGLAEAVPKPDAEPPLAVHVSPPALTAAAVASAAGDIEQAVPPLVKAPAAVAEPVAAERAAVRPPPLLPRWPLPPAAQRTVLYGAIGAAAVVAVLLAGGFLGRNLDRSPAPSMPVRYKVSVIASPVGAEIKLNGQPCGHSVCEMTLGEGSYQAQALLAGYQQANATFSVSAEKGAPPAVELTLTPTPRLVTISSDLAEGQVLLDGSPAAQIQDGGAEVANISPGPHELVLRSGDRQALLNLTVSPGIMPTLSTPIQATGLRVFVLVGSGAEARLYGSPAGAKVTLDGKPVSVLPPDGLELSALSATTHELVVEGHKAQRDQLVFESKGSAAIHAWFKTVAPAKRSGRGSRPPGPGAR